MRARPVPDWRIPLCQRPNQVPSPPKSKRDCPTHGCGASFFFLCSFFRHLFFADDHCWSALTRPEGGRDPARPARHARWANPVAPLLGNEKQEWILCMLRGGGLPWKSWRPDMPSPDIRVTSRPTQTWAHGHVHLQILARISSLALIPPNPPESRVSFCGPPSLECSLYA